MSRDDKPRWHLTSAFCPECGEPAHQFLQLVGNYAELELQDDGTFHHYPLDDYPDSLECGTWKTDASGFNEDEFHPGWSQYKIWVECENEHRWTTFFDEADGESHGLCGSAKLMFDWDSVIKEAIEHSRAALQSLPSTEKDKLRSGLMGLLADLQPATQRDATLQEITDLAPAPKALLVARELAYYYADCIRETYRLEDGGVHIRWQSGTRSVDVAIDSNGGLQYCTDDSGDPSRYSVGQCHCGDLVKLLTWVSPNLALTGGYYSSG